MNNKLFIGIATFTASIAVSSYILARTCTLEVNKIAMVILAVASFLLIDIHIFTCVTLKPNALWTVSKAIIIPEIIITYLMFIWKPLVAFIEASFVIISMVYSFRSIFFKTEKCNAKSKGKVLLRCVNVNLLLSSIILIPGIFIMFPYITNSGNPLFTIQSHDISAASEYSIAPEKWKWMTISQKIEFIDKFTEALADELHMETTPNVGISYLSWSLCGCYSRENDLILVSAGIVQQNDSAEIVKTISHEFFHRQEHQLVEDYSNGLLSSDNVSDDVIKRIESYFRDFQNYSSGGITDASYNKYYNQPCEIDARAFSELMINRYFNT